MALARIITRSHTCSRQLAFDLIARGYAVEIVSPDSIPDNLADLELRVEEDPGNQLVASVEAHNGEHTASLEFLHYLKAPMPDFIRRLPEPREAIHLPEPAVSINVEQSAEEVKLPADAPQLAPTVVSPAAKILHHSKLDPELGPKPDPIEGARLISPPDLSPSLSVERPCHVAVEVSTMSWTMIAKSVIAKATIAKLTIAKLTIAKLVIAKLAIARTVREWKSRDLPAGWSSRRVALTVVGAVLLVVILGFGMRRTGKASAQNYGAASTDMNLLNATVPEKDAGKNPVSPPATKPDDDSNHTPKESQVAKAAAAAASSGAMVTRRHGDDLIARDTVTYLDKRTFDKSASRAQTSQPSASRQPISGKRDGVIAANTVTELNNNPDPKAAKPDSGIKRYSDLK
jgi:hypothetical protein